jgi:hypothetical protein
VVGPVPTHPVPSKAKTAERVLWCKELKDRPPVLWWGGEFVDRSTVYEEPLPQTAIHCREDRPTMTECVGCSGSLKHCMLLAVSPKVPALPAVAGYAARMGTPLSKRVE